MNNNHIVSIVLGSYNRYKYLKPAIESIRAEVNSFNIASEIIVIEGGSTDGSLEWLVKQKDIITIVQHNRGEWRGKKIERRSWGYFMNLGFKTAQGKYICMLSDDCLVIPGAVKNGIEEFEKQLSGGIRLGALAFYWRNWPYEKNYKAALLFGNKAGVNHGLYYRKALEDIGYADGLNYHFYYADGDLVLRMYEKGYITDLCKKSYIEHHAHANEQVRATNFDKEQDDLKYFNTRWEKFAAEGKGVWDKLDFEDEFKTIQMFPISPKARLRKLLNIISKKRNS